MELGARSRWLESMQALTPKVRAACRDLGLDVCASRRGGGHASRGWRL